MSVRAKKHLGQHFLKDQNIARKIVDSLTWNDYQEVLEIGPGMGVLTQYLIQDNRKVSVVEIDTESVEYLNKEYNPITEGLKIYSEDFLKMSLKDKFNAPIAIIGNFPYNISTQILFRVLDNKNMIPEVVGMFQKEVAERIAADHGNKTYGVSSVLLQAYYHVEYLFTVHENVFSPPPRVKSAVIRLQRRESPLPIDNDKDFFRTVKAAFSQRRKTLRNALKSINYPEQAKDWEIMNLRAEQVSVEDFVKLSNQLHSSI